MLVVRPIVCALLCVVLSSSAVSAQSNTVLNRSMWISVLESQACSSALIDLSAVERQSRLGILNGEKVTAQMLRYQARSPELVDALAQQQVGPPPDDLAPLEAAYLASMDDDYAPGLLAEADGLDAGDSDLLNAAADHFQRCDQVQQQLYLAIEDGP